MYVRYRRDGGPADFPFVFHFSFIISIFLPSVGLLALWYVVTLRYGLIRWTITRTLIRRFDWCCIVSKVARYTSTANSLQHWGLYHVDDRSHTLLTWTRIVLLILIHHKRRRGNFRCDC